MEYCFNFQNLLSISVGCTFQFVLLASVFFFYKGRHDRLLSLLAWILLLWGVVGLRNIFLLAFNLDFSAWAGDVTYIVEMLTVPITVAFLIEFVCPQSITSRNMFFILLPYMLLLFLMIFIPRTKILIVMFAVSIVYTIISFSAVVVTIPRYENWFRNNFSNTENMNVIWMWLILLLFNLMFILWIVSVFCYNIVYEVIFNIIKPICWMCIFYFTYRQQKEFSYIREQNEILSENNVIAVVEDDDSANHFIGFDIRLKKAFVEPKLFLNKSLTITELAQELNTNRTYLSYYFNKVLHVTFYDFVNEYRLEYASQLLLSSPDLSIEEVGEMSGFNSLSTFRRSFNKYFDCNPKEYRKNNETL